MSGETAVDVRALAERIVRVGVKQDRNDRLYMDSLDVEPRDLTPEDVTALATAWLRAERLVVDQRVAIAELESHLSQWAGKEAGYWERLGGPAHVERLLCQDRERLEAVEQQINVVLDERASSFERFGAALGGVSLTPYQAEVDIEIEARITALVAERARLFDLVRHQRAPLLDAGLITCNEYATLLSDGSDNGSVARLQTYDELRSRAEATDARVREVESALGVDAPWPVQDVLRRLASAVDHLLGFHHCDHQGWEMDDTAKRRALEIADAIDVALATASTEGGEA